MPQRFGDSEFTGNVRIRGRLLLDNACDTGLHDAMRVVEQKMERLISGCDSRGDAGVESFRRELDMQRQTVDVLQAELGVAVASMHANVASRAQTEAAPADATLKEIAAMQNRLEETIAHVQALSKADTQIERDVDVMRTEISALRSDKQTTVVDDVAMLRRAVDDVSVQVRRVTTDNKRSNIVDVIESVVESAVAELRNEFTNVQRQSSLSTKHSALEATCAKLNDELVSVQSTHDDLIRTCASLREDCARESDRAELQRRQMATVVSELDAVKRLLRT